MVNNERMFQDAVDFAMRMHEGQHRKSSDLPYVLHPLECATIAASLTDDMEVIVAALLHDVLEDTEADDIIVAKEFPGRVLFLIQAETEPVIPGKTKKESWKERKAEMIHRLEETKDQGLLIVALADKLSNMRSFYRMYLEEGDWLWNKMDMIDPYVQVEFYRDLLRCFLPLKETAAYKEFEHYFGIIFRR